MSKLGEYIMCYFDNAGENFCVDVYKFGAWESNVIIPCNKMEGLTFHALDKTFLIQSTPEIFSIVPSEAVNKIGGIEG